MAGKKASAKAGGKGAAAGGKTKARKVTLGDIAAARGGAAVKGGGSLDGAGTQDAMKRVLFGAAG
jgi:hypothetical protein